MTTNTVGIPPWRRCDAFGTYLTPPGWDRITIRSHRGRPNRAPWWRIGTGVGFPAREFSRGSAMGRYSCVLSHWAGLTAGNPLNCRVRPLHASGMFPRSLANSPVEPDYHLHWHQRWVGTRSASRATKPVHGVIRHRGRVRGGGLRCTSMSCLAGRVAAACRDSEPDHHPRCTGTRPLFAVACDGRGNLPVRHHRDTLLLLGWTRGRPRAVLVRGVAAMRRESGHVACGTEACAPCVHDWRCAETGLNGRDIHALRIGHQIHAVIRRGGTAGRGVMR